MLLIPNSRALAVLVIAASLPLVACGDDGAASDGTKTVVVTYSVLGAVVRDVVGDAATVKVLMPDGIDPHDWEPSAKDIAALSSADLVVANGLDLEESLAGALSEAADDGVDVFFAGDHIDVRTVGEGETSEGGEGSDDPHLWMSPVVMEAVVEALGPALAAAGIDVGTRGDTVRADLKALDVEVSDVLSVVAEEDRKLVTGHESLGYFADQYGFTLIGAVVPSLSSQAEASAGELADLRATIEASGVRVIFTELGTSPSVVAAIADETGAEVAELATHNLPDDGTYRGFMLSIANTVAAALQP